MGASWWWLRRVMVKHQRGGGADGFKRGVRMQTWRGSATSVDGGKAREIDLGNASAISGMPIYGWPCNFPLFGLPSCTTNRLSAEASCPRGAYVASEQRASYLFSCAKYKASGSRTCITAQKLYKQRSIALPSRRVARTTPSPHGLSPQ
jgi:hypothetical protein